MLRTVLLIPFLTLAGEAFALIAVTAHGGAALSQLGQTSGTVSTGTGFAYGASVTWQPGTKQKLSVFSLGLSGMETRLRYTQNTIERRATYSTFGPQLGFYKAFSDTFGLQILAQYSPIAELSSLSTNTVALNGDVFRYSTWESYKGGAAAGARLTLIHDKINGQFTRKNRFRSGIGLSYSTQTFTQAETRVSTSRDALAPSVSSTTEEVSLPFSLMTFDFFVGLSF